MSVVTVHEAKTNLSRLIAEALEGRDVVIARGSEPVVRLTALKPAAKRTFGALKSLIAVDERFNDPLPEDELAAWGEE